ncbi:hypothetical protein [Streptomyces olivaceiscleroticus]|uniref:Phage tail protein n=1 Tax=Streptomyces olivaceiscleroticus TaxID=68245 RepID=A0ABN1BLF9_9ACTN
MSQWNLSVQLTGHGSDLVATLKDSAKEARKLKKDINKARNAIKELRDEARNDIQIGVTVDAGRLRSDVAAAVQGAGGHSIDVQLSVDGDHLRQEVNDSLSTAGSGQGVTVDLGLRDSMQLRHEVSDAVRWASMNQAITIPLDVDAASLANLDSATTGSVAGLNNLKDAAQDVSDALRTLRRRAAAASSELDELRNHAMAAAVGLRSLNTAARNADGRLDTLSTRSRSLRTDLDDLDDTVGRLGGSLDGLRGSLGGLNSSTGGARSNMRSLLAILVGLSTAAVPVAAAVVPLAASLGAAGVSAGAFGIALAGQIPALSDAAEAQTKYDEAVRDHGATSKEAAEASMALQAQMAAMPAPTRRAAAALSSLRKQYTDWSDSLAGDTMPVAVKGFETLSATIPKLTPMVKGAATEMDRLVTITAGGVASGSFDRLFGQFEDFANLSIREVTDEIVHLMRVLSEGTGGSAALQEVMDYARRVGPQVAESLRSVGDAFMTLLEASAEMGISALTVVNALAQLVAAVPPGALSVFFQLALALKAVQLASMGFSALSGLMAAFAAQLTAARTAAAGAVGPLASVAAGFMALSRAAKVAVIGTVIGGLVVALTELANIGKSAPPDVDKLTTSLGNFARTGKVAGELARSFGKDLGGLADSLRTLARPSNTEKTQQFLTKLIGMDSTPVKIAKENLDGIDKSLANLVKNGNPELAAAALERISKTKLDNLTPKEFRAQLDDYKSAIADMKFEQQLAADSMGVFGQQAISTSAQLDKQKASADGLRQSIQALNDVNRAGLGGMIGFEAAIDAATKAAQANAGALTMSGGQLNLNSEKARNAATALNDLATKTDEAAASARQSGASWEEVNGIYARGRTALINTAMQMGLTKAQAETLASSILKIPDKKSTQIEMRHEDAIAGLDEVIAKIQATPDAKSVKVNALTDEARILLEGLGYKVETLPDGTVKVTALTGTALANLGAVKAARDALRDKSVTLTVLRRTIYETVQRGGGSNQAAKNAYETTHADGGITLHQYADGGIQRGRVRHFANGSENHIAQIAPAGAWRVWAEPETQGEAYIPLAASKRTRSRAITEETVRRLGGDPRTIAWNADGNVTDWRYDPQTGSLYSSSDAGQAGHKTKKVTVRGKGGKKTTKEVDYFSLSAVESKLKSASKATQSWNKDLEKVADRVGTDVADALASMGKDGVALTKKMAYGSTKYINQMADALRGLSKTAKASLSDYTRQLTAANKIDATFATNLGKLAAAGYGDLAKQLAAQNDKAAQELAAAAVKDRGKAKSANAAAKTANNSLTSDQVAQLVAIIAAVKSSKTGIHDVAASTGLGEDEIIATAGKARSQISSSLGSRATRFLSDLGKAQKGLAYANGGIRSGIYATRGGAVTFAEPSTGGEAYIPLGANKRGSATRVLGDVAGRFGLGLTDANAGKVVIIREQGPLVGNQVYNVTSGGNAVDTAREVESRTARQMRRLARGGAAAR